MASRSLVKVLPDLLSSRSVLPTIFRLLLIVSRPMPLSPGASVPLLVTAPLITPVPPKVPSDATVTALPDASEPLTSSLPELTSVGRA